MMGLRANPTQRQRRLGTELRRLRDESGLTATSVGRELGFSAAHLNNIESGRTGISATKLRTLAELYGCRHAPLIDELVAMSQSNGRGWWSEFNHPPHNDSARDLAELEAMSVRHRNFQWVNMPGLLQTSEYMKALFRSGQPDGDEDTWDRFVQFRRRRQRLLTEARPPTYHAIIHEAALRMEFVPRGVMRRQIEHLVDMARLPNVTVQILPFHADEYPPAFSSPFNCLDAALPELNTVYVEHPTLCPFVIDQGHLTQFSDAFQKLSEVALPPIDVDDRDRGRSRRTSLGLVQHILYEL
ncbi:helix-turn-helix domain-containing protein [Streptomyces sp. 4N509B]|uniref:helix-turn-helix domain-containing protein n=1 Tax=Streptomyces sp. 4N509B TaxID=3457413 RepID=UPI003FD5F560